MSISGDGECSFVIAFYCISFQNPAPSSAGHTPPDPSRSAGQTLALVGPGPGRGALSCRDYLHCVESGAELNVEMWQKIALARAYMSPPPRFWLPLDERAGPPAGGILWLWLGAASHPEVSGTGPEKKGATTMSFWRRMANMPVTSRSRPGIICEICGYKSHADRVDA